MIDKRLLEEPEGVREQYETPCVTMSYWSEDVLTNSTDVGVEYPDYWE